MTRPVPGRAQLLELARRFAREVHGIEPPEAGLVARVDYVLWGRKRGWERVEAGEMSELELRELLLDHFDYECADISGRSIIGAEPGQVADLVAAFDRVLFGRTLGARALQTKK